MAPPSCVVLDPRGLVIHVDGGASTAWLGHHFADVVGASPPARRAASELLGAPGFFRRTVTEDGIEVVVLEAVPLRRAHTPVADLLGRTMETFLQQARAADVELHVVRGEDVPASIFVDGEKISWALGALVGSAIRHAVQGKAHPARVDVTVSSVDDDLSIVVQDSGVGFPPSVARWLFSSDPATGKTAGTALRLVADVVAAHRGEIAASGAPGHGATFTLRLPRR